MENFKLNSQPLISVIVPVYNVELYIKRCVESIINQNYKNIEILLINDGSIDDSLLECKKLVDNDSRIKLLDQENMGVSSARNRGILESKGEYIVFVDSDDWIENDMISSMYDVMIKENSDVVSCGIAVVNRDGSEFERFNDGGIKTYFGNDLLKGYLLGTLSHGCWDKLYKKELLKNIWFPTGTIAEDRYFCWDIYKKTNKLTVLSEVKYHYIRRNSNSITATKFSKNSMTRIEQALKVKIDIDIHYPELYEEWVYYYFMGLENVLKKYVEAVTTKLRNKEYDKFGNYLISSINKTIEKKTKYLSHSDYEKANESIKKLQL